MIEIQNLMKEFGNVTPLKDVNLSIRKGEVVAIIGPSGCGKSTLLRCINMLEHPSSGTIAVCGEEVTAPGCDLSKLRLKVGMIFQSFNLFQHQTVIENIMGPQMKVLGRGKQEAYDKAFSLLANVGLMQTQFQFPDELSGGQQQRVAIARALAMDPEILLLDEPTSALDPTMVGEVEAVLRNLVKQGTTMVLVTHDMNLARSIATRIVYLDEGVVYEEGAPEQIFLNPQREKTRRFIRSKQSLDIRVDGRAFDFPKAIASIELFGHRQGLSEKLLYRLQMAFEELCMIYLPGEVDGTFHAFASFDFDEKTNEVTLSIKHNAGVIPDEQLDSELSLIVIMRTAQDVQQEAVEEEGSPYTGKLTLIYQKEVGNAR